MPAFFLAAIFHPSCHACSPGGSLAPFSLSDGSYVPRWVPSQLGSYRSLVLGALVADLSPSLCKRQPLRGIHLGSYALHEGGVHTSTGLTSSVAAYPYLLTDYWCWLWTLDYERVRRSLWVHSERLGRSLQTKRLSLVASVASSSGGCIAEPGGT